MIQSRSVQAMVETTARRGPEPRREIVTRTEESDERNLPLLLSQEERNYESHLHWEFPQLVDRGPDEESRKKMKVEWLRKARKDVGFCGVILRGGNEIARYSKCALPQMLSNSHNYHAQPNEDAYFISCHVKYGISRQGLWFVHAFRNHQKLKKERNRGWGISCEKGVFPESSRSPSSISKRGIPNCLRRRRIPSCEA